MRMEVQNKRLNLKSMKGLFTLQEVVVLQAGQRIQKVAGRSARMRRFAGWKGALFGLMGLLLSLIPQHN